MARADQQSVLRHTPDLSSGIRKSSRPRRGSRKSRGRALFKTAQKKTVRITSPLPSVSGLRGRRRNRIEAAKAISAPPTGQGSPPGSKNIEGVRIEVTCEGPPVHATRRAVEVALRFGLTLGGGMRRIVGPVDLETPTVGLCAVAGPSGSGKSSLLAEIRRRSETFTDVTEVRIDPDATILDAVAPQRTLAEALSILSACGLAEAPLWLRRYEELSEGEKFRARLAIAVGLDRPCGAALICDEFGTNLHRRAARALAYNVRRLVRRENLALIVATCHDDVIEDLNPDVLVRLDADGRSTTVTAGRAARAFSLRRELRIAPGLKRDYDALASRHYRTTEELGFVDKVFTMRDRSGEVLGVVVYAHGPLELALRNEATGGRFIRRPDALNRSVRILRRLIIHPDVRGCGLGQHLVRMTMPRVGTEYVECLAAMGDVNPVFERAGMRRIGQVPSSQSGSAAVKRLRELGVDPLAPDLAWRMGRSVEVRQIVTSVVTAWYQATTAGGERRVARQSPQFLARTFRGLLDHRPVYYLWRREGTR